MALINHRLQCYLKFCRKVCVVVWKFLVVSNWMERKACFNLRETEGIEKCLPDLKFFMLSAVCCGVKCLYRLQWISTLLFVSVILACWSNLSCFSSKWLTRHLVTTQVSPESYDCVQPIRALPTVNNANDCQRSLTGTFPTKLTIFNQ